MTLTTSLLHMRLIENEIVGEKIRNAKFFKFSLFGEFLENYAYEESQHSSGLNKRAQDCV